MQQQSVRNLDAREFEWVCSGIIGEIAKVYGDVPTGPSELMAPSTDGGIEAKIPTTSGWLAVQCKAYPGAGFDKEIGSIKRSFTTFLGRPEHGGVTRYIWCSTADRTGGTGVSGAKHSSPGNDAKAKQAIAAMTAEAAKRGRTVDVAIRFATDLDEIVRTERPEYAAVMASLTPFRLEDVRRYSAARAGSILTRLGGELAPQLEFPAPRTADLLDRLSDSTRPNGRIRLDGLTELIDELHRREHALPAASPLVTDVRDACAAVLAAGTAVQGSLTLSATELEAPLTELRDRSAAVSTLARTTVGARLPLPEDSEDERPVLKAILRVAASAAALHTHAELLACEAEAARTRRLLISGAWGTGKSYQLAEYTRRASDAGIPVLLLRARDFTATDDPILAQPWRGAFENRNAEPTEIAAMLDAIGHRSVRDGGSPLVLIVDGLNEASIRDLPVALQRLFDTVGRFPSLRLVLSNREDRMPVADGGVPEFHHDRPERAVLSRAVERTLNAPAGTRWHAVVSNPLLASVAVRVISARPDQADRVLSRTGLFEAWVDLLSDEAAAALQMPRATVQRIIGTITHAGGSSDITGIARKAETPAPIVDRVVDRLIDEGLLESAGDDAVRVHWDGLSETLRMRRAIADGSVDALFRELPSGKRESALALLAELLPQAERRLELPDFPVPNVTDDQRDFAFALSLNERTDGSIHAGTGVLAERMLRAGGDAGQAVLWSVLSVPGRSRIGVTWLCDILRSTPLAQRSRFWPTILEDLCERSPSDQDDMEELLSWLSTERWPELSEDQADPVVEILTWMTCANDHTGLPGFAVSSLVEIAHRHPTLLKTVLGRVADVDDDHPRDALFAAAAGIIARWPESPSAHIVRDVCTDALRSDLAVQSYASLAAIHRAIDSRVPMHAFLDHALPPLRVRRLRFSPRRRDLIRDDDRAMFADARSERDAERFETDILDAMGVPVTGRDAVVDIGDAFDGHGLSLVRGRWLARQYAKHPFGARLSVGFVPVKAGRPRIRRRRCSKTRMGRGAHGSTRPCRWR
ncbi:P-loop NTPase family protein [Microbacterium sp. GXF0217]